MDNIKKINYFIYTNVHSSNPEPICSSIDPSINERPTVRYRFIGVSKERTASILRVEK